jgi:predicted transcriptional regulator
MTEVKLEICSIAETMQRFKDAWQRAEAGDNLEEHTIAFDSYDTMIKTLTSARYDILKYLSTHEVKSIRALSLKLGKDYKNVHQDVTALKQHGFITDDLKLPFQHITANVI